MFDFNLHCYSFNLHEYWVVFLLGFMGMDSWRTWGFSFDFMSFWCYGFVEFGVKELEGWCWSSQLACIEVLQSFVYELFVVFVLCPILFSFALSRDWMVKLGKCLAPMVKVVKSSSDLGRGLVGESTLQLNDFGRSFEYRREIVPLPLMLISHRIVWSNFPQV